MSLKHIIQKDIHLLEMFRGSSVAFLFKFLGVLANYLLLYVLAQYFGPSGVGIFSTSWTILMIAAVIGKLGFDSSIVKFIAEAVSSGSSCRVGMLYKRSLAFVFASSSLIALLVYLASDIISQIFFKLPEAAFFIRMLSLTIVPFAIMQLNAEAMKGLKRIVHYSVFQHGTVYFLMVVLVFAGRQIWQDNKLIVFGLALSAGVLMIASFIMLAANFRNSGIGLRKGSYAATNKNLLAVTIPMMFTNSLFLVMNWTDILMLSSFTNEASVGIYNAGLKIGSLNTVALVAVNSIAAPKFAELYTRHDKRGLRRLVKQTSLLNTLVSFPVIVIIMIFPEWLLQLFGQEFAKGSTAMIVLAAGQFFSAFSGSTLMLLNMTDGEKTARNIILISTMVNIMLNYILIPVIGINGAAISTAFSTILWNLIAVIVIYRYFGFLTYPLMPLHKMKEAITILFIKKKKQAHE